MWFNSRVSLEDIKSRSQETLTEHLGIEVTEIKDDALLGRMPIDKRTVQPLGLVHGGASCALAESLGSIASNLVIDPEKYIAVGQSITANHIKSARSGFLHGEATALHLGRRSHVWNIRMVDDDERLICTSRLTMAIIEKSS